MHSNSLDGMEIILSTTNHKILKKCIVEVGDNSHIVLEGSHCQLEISDVEIQTDGLCCENDINNSVLLSNKNGNFNGKWIIGDATCYIDADIETCLTHMYMFEMSQITVNYLNKADKLALSISCKIRILNVCESELFCDWSLSRKLTYAKTQKSFGKDLVKRNRIIEGFSKFSKALKALLSLDKLEDLANAGDDVHKDIALLKVDLYNNLAFCQLQYNEFEAVVDLCNKALELNKNSEKALYRRGCAFMGLEECESAYADICQVLAMDPNNSAAKSKAALLREKVKHINERYKKVIKSMFV